MAALNFPNSPSLNDTHTENGVTFKWNGAAWDRLGDIGAQGSVGAQGAAGAAGAQGATGPVAGSSSQVVYKDGSNNPAGSSNFTFDGTNLTVGGNVSIGGTLTYEDVTNIDSVGIITARNAVVISEDNAIHFGGTAADDTDAILRASAGGGQLLINSRNDTIINIDSNNDSTDAHFAIAHGAATGSSTELFRVQENGNTGVGNADPTQARLVAQTASGSSLAAIKDNTGGSIVIGGVTQPRVLMEASHTASEFRIYTAGGSSYGSASWTERLRITSSGNLQLYPGGNLQMASNGRIFVGNGGNATDPMFANVSDTNTGIAFPAADTMMFTTGGTERLRITSAGQMGLGTNDPNAYGGLVKLAVANTSGTCGLSIVSATNGDGNLYYADGTSGDATYRGFIRYNHTTDQFRIGVAGAERLRIDSYGKVGINTNAATARLDISHPHTEQGLVVRSRYGNIATAMVKFDGDPDSDGGDGNVLHLHGGSSRTDSEILHIDSTGVGDIFDIRGDGLTRVYKQLQLEHSSNVAKIIFNEYGANDPKAQIEMDQVNGSAGQLIFRTQDSGTLSERLRITSGGQVNIGGNYTQTSYQLQVDGSVKGDYFTGESLSNRTGYKWGASGIYYLTLGGSRSGNASSFTMFELTGMQNSKFVEIQISFAHAGGGSHGSYRRAVYTSNGYQGLNTLENVQYNYGGGSGFTISKPSNSLVRVVWNGCTGFQDGFVLCCEVKTSNSGTVFQNVDSAFT